MLGDAEIFASFRWLLAIICTVYTTIYLWKTLWGWLLYFASSRECKILGRYTLALLLRIRVKQFAWELAQIGGLLAVLAGLLYAHRWIG
jgi:hypothetical protein